MNRQEINHDKMTLRGLWYCSKKRVLRRIVSIEEKNHSEYLENYI